MMNNYFFPTAAEYLVSLSAVPPQIDSFKYVYLIVNLTSGTLVALASSRSKAEQQREALTRECGSTYEIIPRIVL